MEKFCFETVHDSVWREHEYLQYQYCIDKQWKAGLTPEMQLDKEKNNARKETVLEYANETTCKERGAE